MSNVVKIKDEAEISFVFQSEHEQAVSPDALKKEIQDGIACHLDMHHIKAPQGPEMAARQFTDAFSLRSNISGNRIAFTLSVHHPKTWLDSQIGKDEFTEILEASATNVAESISQLQFGQAVDNMLTFNQMQREKAFENAYIALPASPSGMLTLQQMQGRRAATSPQGCAFLYGADTILISTFQDDVSELLPDNLVCMPVRQARQWCSEHLLDIVDSRTRQPSAIPTAHDIAYQRQAGRQDYASELIAAMKKYGRHASFSDALIYRLGAQMTPALGMQIGHLASEQMYAEATGHLTHYIDNQLTHSSDHYHRADALMQMHKKNKVSAFFTGMNIGQQYKGSNIANTLTWQALTPSAPKDTSARLKLSF